MKAAASSNRDRESLKSGESGGNARIIRIKPVLRANPLLLLSFLVVQYVGLQTLLKSDGELGLLIMAAGLAFLAPPAWKILTNTYEVRDNRVTAIHGFIAISSVDVLMERIITVEYRQSVLGRLLGFGDVLVSSAAQDNADIVMKDVAKPRVISDGIRAILREHAESKSRRKKGEDGDAT